MELNFDIDINSLPFGEESSQEVESALKIINAIPDIDISDLPVIDVEGIGNTINADMAHRGIDCHKLRVSKR